MGDDPNAAPEGEPVHPDPKGKMRSHAPGYTTGPDGASVKLEEEEKPTEEAPKTE